MEKRDELEAQHRKEMWFFGILPGMVAGLLVLAFFSWLNPESFKVSDAPLMVEIVNCPLQVSKD
jgi:hypothetical protein